MTAAEINRFLSGYGSPLAGLGGAFMRAGNRYGVDPRLLVAISGAESSFGKNVKAGTHNPFGWGPHIPFGSWREGIFRVARGLRENYLDKGYNTLGEIGGRYVYGKDTPLGRGDNWFDNASAFMQQLGGQGGPYGPGPSGGGPGPAFAGGGAGGGMPADPRAALLMSISSFRSPEDAMSQTPMVAAAMRDYRQGMQAFNAAGGYAGGFGGPMEGTGGTLDQAQLMRQLIRMVQQHGGRAGENPFSDRVDPVHTEGSYHYQRFRDNPNTRFNESRLGRGLDVSGLDMGSFLQAVLRRFGMGAFTEIFYDPWGQFDSGRYSRRGIGGHGDHIHFSV